MKSKKKGIQRDHFCFEAERKKDTLDRMNKKPGSKIATAEIFYGNPHKNPSANFTYSDQILTSFDNVFIPTRHKGGNQKTTSK